MATQYDDLAAQYRKFQRVKTYRLELRYKNVQQAKAVAKKNAKDYSSKMP